MDRLTLLEELNQLDELEASAMSMPAISLEALIEEQHAWYKQGNEVILSSSLIMESHEKIAFRKHPRFISVIEHKHDFLELTYALKGTATQIINGERVLMQQGDIIILDTNILHTIEPLSTDSIVINILMKEAYFNEQLLVRLSENQVISEFITSAIYRKSLKGRYLFFSRCDNSRIRNYIESAVWELTHPQLGSHESVKCYMILLFTELMRSIQYESALKNEPTRQTVKTSVSVFAIIQFISEHFMDYGLEETAHHFHIHPKYLTRLLKNYTGKSYIEMVQELRMEKAVALLHNTQKTIHEIAYESDFSNVNQFYKHFKKTYNQTPYEYRKGLEQGRR